MEIQNHLLVGDNVSFIKATTHGGPYKPGDLDTIIMHFTSGPNPKSAVSTFLNPRMNVSAHLIIGRDQTIIQMVPFNLIAWHAGKSEYKGRIGFNNYSIGIEIDNAGILTKSGDTYRAWFGTEYQESDVIQAIHRNEKDPRYWHAYTDWQLETVDQISTLLIQTYGIKQILGHEEIAPDRKWDPGPAFPLDKMRTNLLGIDRDATGPAQLVSAMRVGVPKLNMRDIPDPTGNLVNEAIPQGTRVEILEQKDGWYRVRYNKKIDGYVMTQYIGEVAEA